VKVAGVLLGGGESRRFGSPKLEATLGGRRLVDIACANFLDAGFEPVVFCGRARPQDPRVLVVEPGAEMIATLRSGLAAVPDGPFAFAPADMPFLRPPLLRELREAFLASGKPFLVPVLRGRRGHPAFSRAKEPFLRIGGRGGARDVWRQAGTDLVHHGVATEAVLFDVDWPADLAAAVSFDGMQAALDHLEENRDRFLDLLLEYLRIPSVSAQKACHADARRAAGVMRGRLEEASFEASRFEGDGLPTVHSTRTEGRGRPTLLVYGHYDVQPPEPLDLWESPPFEPAIVDGEIRARGCADDKGPSLALVLAAECWVKATGSVPVDLKFVIEGEEECGGTVVEKFLRAKKADLRADALVIADAPGAAKGVPGLCYGLRGLIAAEVTLFGPSRDLHSGGYGGTVANPATALARLVATLHDGEGRVAIEGFQAGVRPLDAAERARLAAIPYDEKSYLGDTGSPALFGEPGFSTIERRSARPTCEVNGIFGGYQGEGSKTIVPSKATCKITCRLVPDQDPKAALDALERHLRKHCPKGVRMELRRGHTARAVLADPETPWAKAARRALERGFDRPPVLLREGGSIPVVNHFQEVLGLAPLILGTYAPGEKAHSPNERYFVDDFFAAIRTGIHLYGSGA
jgi:acetylornithine deacetylase/succinyl-diaminopimelate desuccinylase-like protein/CTP:molybdopterin cytidylyltransferase MocA